VDYPVGTGGSPPTTGLPTLVTGISTSAAFYLLNGVIEGASNFNRLGRRIRLKTINISMNFYTTMAVAAPGAPAHPVQPRIRVALVYDRQPSTSSGAGVMPAYNDIWQQRDQFGIASNYEWSPINVDNTSRFIVLRDCKINYPTNNGLELNQVALSMNNAFIEGTQCKMFKKLRMLETNFRSNTTGSTGNTVGDIQSGGLYIVFISNINPDSSNILAEWTSRLRFYDAL